LVGWRLLTSIQNSNITCRQFPSQPLFGTHQKKICNPSSIRGGEKRNHYAIKYRRLATNSYDGIFYNSRMSQHRDYRKNTWHRQVFRGADFGVRYCSYAGWTPLDRRIL